MLESADIVGQNFLDPEKSEFGNPVVLAALFVETCQYRLAGDTLEDFIPKVGAMEAISVIEKEMGSSFGRMSSTQFEMRRGERTKPVPLGALFS